MLRYACFPEIASCSAWRTSKPAMWWVDLAGVGVWFQLLTALVFTHEQTGQERLLLGEAFVAPDFAGLIDAEDQLQPRNACIIPWERVTALKEEGGELVIELADGRLRIIPADADPGAGWLPS